MYSSVTWSVKIQLYHRVISSFRREVDENCVLLSYEAASSGNFLTTFRENLSVPSSWHKNPKKMKPAGFSETLVKN
jgi:hypothetical protein